MVSLWEVPDGETFRYLGVEWLKKEKDDLWVEAEPPEAGGRAFYQRLWYSTEVEYTIPVPPPEKGELWSDGRVHHPGRDGFTVWFCQGETMRTASGYEEPTDTFRTVHRPSSYRLYPPAE